MVVVVVVVVVVVAVVGDRDLDILANCDYGLCCWRRGFVVQPR